MFVRFFLPFVNDDVLVELTEQHGENEHLRDIIADNGVWEVAIFDEQPRHMRGHYDESKNLHGGQIAFPPEERVH